MLYSHFDGHIGKDGIVPTKSNPDVMRMDVATEYFSKGEKKTMWIRVFLKKSVVSEKMLAHLTKGKYIHVEGEQVEPSAWIGKDGEAHSQSVIVASIVNFAKTGKKQGDGTQNQTAQPKDSTSVVNSEAPFPAPSDTSDDLPF